MHAKFNGARARHAGDRALAALAARQHGVIARWQIASIGVTRAMLAERVGSGHLIRLHRGVYAVGHRRLSNDGFWMAAVLAVGAGAALSHRDAAALHGLRQANGSKIDVTTAAQRAGTERVRVHGRQVLTAADVTTVAGIPVTTVARTLVDLAGVVPAHQLAKALSEAERQQRLDVGAIDAALARTRGRGGPGHARMRGVLAEHARYGVELTRSVLEERFVALLDAHRLPRPQLNAVVAGREVDALWPERRLVVELDGHAFHSSRAAIRRDRGKDRVLTLAGYRVLRFTHGEVVAEESTVAAELTRALAALG